jgi:hypothetical protein
MKKRIFFFVWLLFAFTATTFAQPGTDCNTVTPSRIQIPNQLYTDRSGLFKKSRVLDKLNKHYGKLHPLSVGPFQLAKFFPLLDKEATATGLKIYFGSFDETESATDNEYAKKYHNMIFPIFVLTKAADSALHRDFGSYYIFNPHTQSLVPVEKASAQIWYDHFKYGLDMHKNEVHTLWYDMADLIAWRKDIWCQQQQDNTIKTITMKWAVYEKDIDDPIKKKYTIPTKDRLTLLFFVPYARRQALKDDGAYDTAVPCPPGSNCDGDELK